MLVNNAAILYDTWQRGVDADLDRRREAFETNLLGAWRVTSPFCPSCARARTPRIVNVSSGAGALHDMGGGMPAYRVSKAALNALTRILAAELRSDGSSSTRSARAGSPPTWAAPAGDRSPRAPRASCGPPTFPTTARRAASSATAARSTGEPLVDDRDRLHLDEHVEEQAGLDRRAAGRWSPNASTHASL